MVRERDVIVAIVKHGVIVRAVGVEAADYTNEHAYDDIVGMMVLLARSVTGLLDELLPRCGL